MSFAHLRARVLPATNKHRRLYDRILRIDSAPQRDELLVMAQRLDAR